MVHEAHDSLLYGGVLFLIPALVSQGLLTSMEIYDYEDEYYYPLEAIILTLAILSLCRVKNIEQIKNLKPGELGRLIGLDRIPESKCLRSKVKLLSSQNKTKEWNDELMKLWKEQDLDKVDREAEIILYIDAHLKIYNGKKANLPPKYVSRQKLCLSALSEYWVHGDDGLPYLVVQGQLNEKLQEIILLEIIPRLIEVGYIQELQDPLTHLQTPQCTLVFDREAYDFEFFQKLWNEYRVAIITYRKFVKDKWEEKDFIPYEIAEHNNKSTMYLCEKKFTSGNHQFREVRKLNNSSHQTSIITTHPVLSIVYIALYMFDRWTQENFFKYMISDYFIDYVIEYGMEAVNEELKLVNPEYKKYNYQLKKTREKLKRRQANLFNLLQEQQNDSVDKQKKNDKKLAELHEEINQLKHDEESFLKLRKQQPYYIKLKDMPVEKRYNKLKSESKLFINIIKMICYRAETAVANILNESMRSKKEEKRMLVKQIIGTPANILPNQQDKTLTVTLHSLSSNRYNEALGNLISVLNDSETVFPGTDLKMIFKSTAKTFT
jgi:hypothetical protein